MLGGLGVQEPDVGLWLEFFPSFFLTLAVELVPWWLFGLGKKGPGPMWIQFIALYRRLLLSIWGWAVGSFEVSNDLTPILVSSTYRITTHGRHVPHSCSGITLEAARENVECAAYVEDHMRLLEKLKLLLMHVALVVLVCRSIGHRSVVLRVAVYALSAALALDWDQVVFAVSILAPTVALLASYQWVLFVAVVAVLRRTMKGRHQPRPPLGQQKQKSLKK